MGWCRLSLHNKCTYVDGFNTVMVAIGRWWHFSMHLNKLQCPYPQSLRYMTWTVVSEKSITSRGVTDLQWFNWSMHPLKSSGFIENTIAFTKSMENRIHVMRVCKVLKWYETILQGCGKSFCKMLLQQMFVCPTMAMFLPFLMLRTISRAAMLITPHR